MITIDRLAYRTYVFYQNLLYFRHIAGSSNGGNENESAFIFIRFRKAGNCLYFLSKAAGSSNGRTSASEAEYLGSSPGPAALYGR